MTSSALAGVALWLAAGMVLLALGLLTRLLVRRAIAEFTRRRLERRVSEINELIREHERSEQSNLDRLLFTLGSSHDPRAVEVALRGRMQTPNPERHAQLKRIYDSLGLTERYMTQLRSAARWAERTAAATALAQLGAVEAIPVLVEAIRDPHEDPRTVKLAAARALGQMHAVEAIPIFIEQLRELDELASPRLAELLTAFGEEALPALHRAIEDEERLNVRIWAAQILGRIGHPASVAYLLPRLSDRAERVRISAAEALGRLGDRRAVHELVRVAMRDPAPPARAEAARALGMLGDEAVMESLVMMLGDRDYWARLRAVEAIEMLEPEDLSMVEEALGDPNEAVRNRAAVALERLGVLEKRLDELGSKKRAVANAATETLVRIGQAGLLQSLLARLEAPDLRVRARVCDVLARVGAREATDAISELLADPAWPVRARAVEALAALRPEDGVLRLVDVLEDPEETVRLAALNAIQTLGVPTDPAQLHTVTRLFAEGNGEIRARVIEAMDECVGDEVDDLLRQGLSDPNAAVRLTAVKVVARRASPQWTEALIPRLGDEDTRIRTAAGGALGRIGTPDALRAVMQNLSTQDRAFRETLTDVLAGQGAGEVLDLVRSSSGLGADRDGLETRLAVVWALGKTGDQRALDLLEEWATDRDAALRASVAGAVAKLPGERAEEILSRMLGDPNERVRAAAVNALGATGATAAVDELAKLTLDPDAFVRNRVAVAVGRLGGIRAGELLEQLMADDDPVRKAYAAIGFGLCGDEHGFQMALAALSDGALRPIVSEKLVREAPEVKARFRKNLNLNDLDPTGSELLSAEQLQQRYVDELQSGQRPERRVAAVQALTSLGLDEHVPVLLRAARADPEPEVRRLALLGMCDESPRGGQMGPDRLEDDEVRDAVAGALKDPDPGVRTVAVGCAERIGDAGNNDALLRCFLVGDDGLHGATVSALAKVNTARVRDFVDEVMAHTDERVLQGAVKTLGQIGDRSVVRLLGMWLRSGSTSMRVACIDALGRVGDAGARDALTGCLGDPSVEIRLEALGRLVGLPGTRAALMRLARDPSANVRSTLVRRAAQRRNEATLVVAETLAQDGEDTVRADALLALLELGTPSELKRFLELHDAQPATVAETLRMAPADEAPVPALLSAAATAAAPEHRALALECAGRLNRTPEPLLLTAMEDPSPEIRIAAVRASTGMESKALDEALDRLLRDPVQEVRDEVRKGRMRIVGGGAA